jgi:hypothetical protein
VTPRELLAALYSSSERLSAAGEALWRADGAAWTVSATSSSGEPQLRAKAIGGAIEASPEEIVEAACRALRGLYR